jgi:hypothetical protein
MKDYISIDGNIIKNDTIKGVSTISENFPLVFEFKPSATYSFYFYYDNKYLHFYESYRIGLFSNKPKNIEEKNLAFSRIENKRNEILNIIKFNNGN